MAPLAQGCAAGSHSAGDALVVASVADRGYTVPVAAMLRSVLRTTTAAASVHLLDMGIAPDDRDRLARICAEGQATLVWYDARGRAPEQLPLTSRMTRATYARLALPRLLPDDVERVIWLDADVLVACDLTELWSTDLRGGHLAAVQDPCVPYVSSRYGVRGWRDLGLEPDAKYFNAGVMLVDVARWRNDEVGERAAEYIRRYRAHCMFWDQEGLNAVLSGQWSELDLRWNYCPAFTPRERPESARVEPAVLHFAGTLKPWLLPVTADGARARFFRVLDETPWAGWRPRRTIASSAKGWYDDSRVRDVLYPVEHWCMLSVGRRADRVARRLRGAA